MKCGKGTFFQLGSNQEQNYQESRKDQKPVDCFFVVIPTRHWSIALRRVSYVSSFSPKSSLYCRNEPANSVCFGCQIYRFNSRVSTILQEDDREDAARLKALHLAWQAQSDDLEKL